MKHTKKLLAFLLVITLFLGIFAGCTPQDPQNTEVNHTGSQNTEVNHTGSQNTEVKNTDSTNGTDTVKTYEKQYCTATVDYDFFGREILITLMPSAEEKEYTLEDFPEIEITKIEKYVSPYAKPEEPKVRLTLTLANPSKENALAAVKKMELRPDVYAAEPDYYDTAASTD